MSLSLIINLNLRPMKEGSIPEYPEKPPYRELKKMPHTAAVEFKVQTRDIPTWVMGSLPAQRMS